MFEERVVLPEGRRIEILLDREMHYRLRFLEGNSPVVEYASDGGGHRRRLRGRDLAYEFKSVEQLRYDFERDAADAQRQG